MTLLYIIIPVVFCLLYLSGNAEETRQSYIRHKVPGRQLMLEKDLGCKSLTSIYFEMETPANYSILILSTTFSNSLAIRRRYFVSEIIAQIGCR